MIKKILLITLSILVFFVSIESKAQKSYAATGDEIRASKKIISVVYDDSGSMNGERWSYTNYAMQALIALLNEQDELYITFMSDPFTAVPIDTSDLSGSIKMIHDWSDSGVTPGEALDTARAKLDSISDTDTTAQFWLVIMTDGGITMSTTLQNKLDSDKNNTMSNETPLNVVYLGMGSAEQVTGDTSKHLHTFNSDNDDEIITTLQDVANLISGRLNADQVKQVDDKTIQVTSTLPLYSISILSQKSSAVVSKAKTDEQDLTVQRNIPLDATDLLYGVPMDTLYGNAAVINNVDWNGDMQVIPAGTYTITFSDEIDINNMNIQFEPAIALKAEISRNGVTIDDMAKLGNGDTVDIKIIPVVPGTDDVIPDSDLPKQITWDIEYEVDGNIVDSGQGTSLTGVTLMHGSNIVRGIINIPGYAPFINEIYFNIAEITYDFGIEVQQPSGLSYDRADMKSLQLDDTNTVKFEITNEGKTLSKDEQKAIGVTLQIDDVAIVPVSDENLIYTAGKIDVKCKLVQNDDGSYSLIPSCPAGVPVLGLEAGDYTVKVSISLDDSVTEEAEFTVVPSMEEAKDIPKIAIGFVISLYLLYILFIKKKFRGQVVHYERYRLIENGRGVLQRGSTSSLDLGFFSGHFLLPTKACYVKYRDLKLVADSDGAVIITGDSIAKAVYAYGTSINDPQDSLGTIIEQLHKTVKSDGRREAAEHELTKKRIYFRSSETSKEVWCIWMTED